MLFRANELSRSIRIALYAGVAVSSLAMGTVGAQTDVNVEGDAVELEKVEVTGSHIKRIDVEGPTPLVVITAEDIENQGFANVQEVLDALPQNLGGSVDASFTFGFTPAASSIDLRGFGNGRTLVLVDGHRFPIYPIGLSGTDNFVDLSAFPSVLVERIEVLTEGASAIYGADAVSGVVNIITRKDYDGVQVTGRYGDTTNGGYQHDRFQIVAGSTNDKTSATIFLEHWENDPVWARDRDYAASDVANPRGVYSVGGASFIRYDNLGIIQAPGCGTPGGPLGGEGIPDQNIPVFTYDDLWCGFNRTAYRMLWAEQEQNSVTAKFDHEFNQELSLFGGATFVQKDNWTQLEPNFWGGSAFGYDSPGGIVPEGADAYVPAGAANNPTGSETDGDFVRRLVEYGPREEDIDETIFTAHAGFRGVVDRYDWEATLGYNQIRHDSTRPNIILSAFNSYVNSGELDLFQPIPQEIVDVTAYTAMRKAESDNVTADFVVTGDTTWEIAGGPVAFAAILDFERQSYSDTSDAITLLGDNFDGASSGGGSRKHYGAGAEFNFPVTDTVELNVAGRYDKYDDDSSVDDAFSPKLSFGWRPIDTLLVRGSWGQSFRAPDMQRLFGADTQAYDTVDDPVTGLQIPSVEVRVGSNIDLEEETGTNLNFGVVWEPIEDLTLKADYYNIKLEDIVNDFDAQFILNECGADQSGALCSLVHRDANGTLNGGYIESNAQNVSSQKIDGIDFVAEYDWDTESWGDFSVSATVAWVNSLKTRLTDTSETVENIGFASIPEWRFGGVFDWNRNQWGATLRVDWIDEMCGTLSSDCPKEDFIDSYMLWNGTVRYDMDEYGKLLVGVHNIFDEDPADDPTDNQWPWFYNNGGYSNPLGRTWYAEYSLEF